MLDSFEKSISLGLGLFAYSREKIEKLVEELVNKGEVAKKDARQFAVELVQRGEEQRDELKNLIRSELTKVLEDVNIAQKGDIVTKDEIREIIREQLQLALAEQEISQNGDKK